MRGNFLLGMVIGAVAVRFWPDIKRHGRPLAKAAMMAGVESFVVARREAARLAEDVEDLVAEVAAEMEQAESASPQADAGVIRAGSVADAA